MVSTQAICHGSSSTTTWRCTNGTTQATSSSSIGAMTSITLMTRDGTGPVVALTLTPQSSTRTTSPPKLVILFSRWSLRKLQALPGGLPGSKKAERKNIWLVYLIISHKSMKWITTSQSNVIERPLAGSLRANRRPPLVKRKSRNPHLWRQRSEKVKLTAPAM